MTPLPTELDGEQVSPELAAAIAQGQRDDESKPPTIRVSPLDKHAHIRRAVEEHHDVIAVHHQMLLKHAELHQIQANARAALERKLTAEYYDLYKRATSETHNETEPLRRSFFGRLRWLLTGK